VGYKNAVRTSEKAHYFSATEPSRLMLRNIWGFHGRDYEECRLLGYKNAVRTSQEIHLIKAVEILAKQFLIFKNIIFVYKSLSERMHLQVAIVEVYAKYRWAPILDWWGLFTPGDKHWTHSDRTVCTV
jgi:hypothetical protein